MENKKTSIAWFLPAARLCDRADNLREGVEIPREAVLVLRIQAVLHIHNQFVKRGPHLRLTLLDLRGNKLLLELEERLLLEQDEPEERTRYRPGAAELARDHERHDHVENS